MSDQHPRPTRRQLLGGGIAALTAPAAAATFTSPALADPAPAGPARGGPAPAAPAPSGPSADVARSEEHTSELQSRGHLVCRLLLEKKNNKSGHSNNTTDSRE